MASLDSVIYCHSYMREKVYRERKHIFISLSTRNFLPGAPHCCFILDRFINREIPFENAWVQLK
jgi:hypothetical protein